MAQGNRARFGAAGIDSCKDMAVAGSGARALYRWYHRPFGFIGCLIALTLASQAAYSDTFRVFGPAHYWRESGAPVLVTSTFEVRNPNAPYTLIIHNGGLEDDTEQGELVSSSVIHLNGELVVGPDRFNQHVVRVEEPVSLAVQNELGVEVRGKPGGLIAIEVVGIDVEPPSVAISSPADGATLETAEVFFSVDYGDAVSGIDADTLVVTINGVDATDLFTIEATNASYTASLPDGQHTVVASVSDRAGNSATIASTFTITTAADLVSKPRAVPTSGEAPLTVQFIPEFETNSAIERFDWDFDGNGVFDRSEVIGRNQTFTYNDPGTYNAVLRITDSFGQQVSGTVVVTVGNAPPVINAEANPSNGQIPLVVTFSASATDSEGIALYEWDFEGDGTFDFSSPTSGNTTFTYTEAGTFQAVVRATDALGASATLALPTTEVRSAPPGSPSVTASAGPVSGTVPLAVSFNATATDPDGQAFTEWAWDFDGDGTFDFSAATPATTFTYTAPGTAFARVRVTAADGGTAEDVVQISVQPSVSLSMSTDTIDTSVGETVGIVTNLGGDTLVSLVLESPAGVVARTLVHWTLRTGGSYTDTWDGGDGGGGTVAEGPYHAVLLYEVDGVVNRLDLAQSTGGQQYNPPRSGMPSSFSPFAGQPLNINFTLSRASEVTAFMGRFSANTRLVTFLQRVPLGRGTHTITWNGENGDGQLIHPPSNDRFLFGIFGYFLPNNAVYVRSGAHVSAVSVSPPVYDPAAHPVAGAPALSAVSFSLSAAADVELVVADADTGRTVARRFVTGLNGGANTVFWDGKDDQGVFVAPGRYRLGVAAIDENGFRSLRVYALQRVYY